MTKQELYTALQEAGVQLPDYRRITAAALEETYENTFGNTPQQSDPQPEQQPGAEQQGDTEPEGVPPALVFECAGWCEALQTSYFMGHYQPKSWAEYEALRPFAKGGNA